jgi:hypothetical protein
LTTRGGRWRIRIGEEKAKLIFIGFASIALMTLAALRSRLEDSLRGKVSAPFSVRRATLPEMAASGIAEIDRLTGGLPRGCLTEITGAAGSGRMSFLVSLLAGLTKRGESCAVVDGRDAFDPCGAEAAGVALGKLLLVRCSNIEQALRGTDLLLHGGGFGLVAVDLSDLPGATVRRVPLNAWFRFRRMVENTATILLLLEQEACAKSCASLVLRLEMEAARWNSAAASAAASTAARKNGGLKNPQQFLLGGLRIRAEVLRSRFEPAAESPAMNSPSSFSERSFSERTGSKSGPASGTTGADCLYETEAAWMDLTGAKQRRGKNFISGRASSRSAKSSKT